MIERGQWRVDYPGLARRLGLPVDQVEVAFEVLEKQDRIKRWIDLDWGYEVVKVINYDLYQSMFPWSEKGHRRTNDEPTREYRDILGKANDEPSTDQRRTIERPTTSH
jgi:hypothetical protein